MFNPNLLRTLAAVPTGINVLDASPISLKVFVPLVELGFSVTVCQAPEETNSLGFHSENASTVLSWNPEDTPNPEGTFAWIVAHRTFDTCTDEDKMAKQLVALQKVLVEGGWMYVCVPAANEGGVHQNGQSQTVSFTAIGLMMFFQQYGWAVAESPYAYDESGKKFWCAIFRKVGTNTIV